MMDPNGKRRSVTLIKNKSHLFNSLQLTGECLVRSSSSVALLQSVVNTLEFQWHVALPLSNLVSGGGQIASPWWSKMAAWRGQGSKYWFRILKKLCARGWNLNLLPPTTHCEAHHHTDHKRRWWRFCNLASGVCFIWAFGHGQEAAAFSTFQNGWEDYPYPLLSIYRAMN